MPISSQYFTVLADSCGEPAYKGKPGCPAYEGFDACHLKFTIAPLLAGHNMSFLITVDCDIYLAAAVGAAATRQIMMNGNSKLEN
jgi:hypothetical protein